MLMSLFYYSVNVVILSSLLSELFFGGELSLKEKSLTALNRDNATFSVILHDLQLCPRHTVNCKNT